MWNIVQSILSSPAGSFAFVFGLICLVGFGLYKIGRFSSKIDEKTKNIEKLENSIDTIKTDIQSIKANLSVLSTGKMSLTQSHSPVSLTDLGKDIAERMKIKTIVADNWDQIQTYLDASLPITANAYDIQQFCIETATINLDKLLPAQILSRIKMFAYNEGNPLAYYGSMIGVIIRDKYFEVKNIPIDSVDKNDPSNS